VQRSTITMEEKGVGYDVTYISLTDKPDWFLKISPFGKVPVLRVGDTTLFESAVINEFIDETTPGRMLPDDPLARAYLRAWIEMASGLVMDAYRLQHCERDEDVAARADAVRDKLGKLEEQIVGPLFSGEAMTLMDAAAAPALQRVGWLEELEPSLALFEGRPKVASWRDALLSRASVKRSTVPEIHELWLESVRKRSRDGDQPSSWLGRRFA
jgi:glutathione S-transferase